MQARPETVQSQKNQNILVSYKLNGKVEADEETVEEVTEVMILLNLESRFLLKCLLQENAKELKKEGKGDEKGNLHQSHFSFFSYS